VIVLAAVTIAAQFTAGPACASQVDALTVTRHEGDFHIVFDAEVDAAARAVYEILADYDRLYRLSPVIAEISVHPVLVKESKVD